ncbi:MAG: tetratricopeptide repeat protein, partial [Pseudolabrys sp.]
MKLICKHAIAIILLMSSFAAPVAAEPIDDAAAAYGKGDYATALQLFRPLADQGMARAQAILGVMYANGQGVPKSDTEAMKWYRLAADQGDAGAQTALGVIYVNGQG